MNLYQVVFGQQSVRTLFKSLAPLFFVNVFFKWQPVAILDVQKLLFTISDQYHNLDFCDFFTKWLPAAILDVQNSLSMASIFFKIFNKMTAVGHFGCPRLTFDHISGHFRSIRNFILF